MRNESTEAEMDRYVETIILPQARRLGDSGALAAWMEQTGAAFRKDAARGRQHQLTPVGLERVALMDAHADLLEQLAREVRETRAPHTRH